MSRLDFYLFDEAPQDLQLLSDNGGDEDFIVVIPFGMKDKMPYLFDVEDHGAYTSLGWKKVYKYDYNYILIFSHA